MIAASDGSQPNAREFLQEFIGDLQNQRIPTKFRELAQGETPDDIATKTAYRQINF